MTKQQILCQSSDISILKCSHTESSEMIFWKMYSWNPTEVLSTEGSFSYFSYSFSQIIKINTTSWKGSLSLNIVTHMTLSLSREIQ